MKKYDVAIIGAGIGGLTCACYLARSGLNVIVLEKYTRVGGCSSSFTKDQFMFDVGVHYFGGLRDSGQLRLIFDELNLWEKINIKRINPSDSVIMGDLRQAIWNDNLRNIEELSEKFPKDAIKIKEFFDFIIKTPVNHLFFHLKGLTFSELLNQYFVNKELKSFFSIFLGNIGLPSFRVAAISAVILFKEYVLDGGYYPAGGIQRLPDALSEIIKNYGGSIKTASEVDKVLISNDRVKNITLFSGEEIEADNYVLACDISSFYRRLSTNRFSISSKKAESSVPSMSACVYYLGINELLGPLLTHECSLWYSKTLEIDRHYENIYQGNVDCIDPCLLFCFPSLHDETMAPANSTSLSIFVGAPFKTEEYWKNEKNYYADLILKKSQEVFPRLQSKICLKEFATPVTFLKYTNNRNGALYGWASTLDQIQRTNFPCIIDDISNLYSASHWTTLGFTQGGIPMTALAGRLAANRILKAQKKYDAVK